MKALVTGGSGFIGSHLVELLIDKGYDVWNLSKHTYSFNPRVLEHLEKNANYTFLPADMYDSCTLLMTFLKEKFDVVFHLAAETHVDRSFIYPRDFLMSNLEGTFSLLEVLRHLKRKPQLILMSTDEVFGDVPNPHKCEETEQIRPRNPYSASKAACEAYVSAWHYSYQVPTVTVRSMNNYGSRQHPEKLIAKIITRNLTGHEYSLFMGDSVRGWVYVKDTCEALWHVSQKGDDGEIYHIPAKDYLTVTQVNEKILACFPDRNVFRGFKGSRLKDDERYALDGNKLRHLGWEPTTSFDDGIRETIQWYNSNRWFWNV